MAQNNRTTRSSYDPIRSGFSSIELLIVMLVMGILAAIAIPKFNASLFKYRSQLATKRLVADLGFASSQARATSLPVKIHFTGQENSINSRYWFDSVEDPHHPGALLAVELADSPYNTEFTSAPASITFDLYGYPDSDAEWSLLGASGETSTIKIDKSTGKVKIQ